MPVGTRAFDAAVAEVLTSPHEFAVPFFVASLVLGARVLEAGAVLCEAHDVHPNLRTADGALALLQRLFDTATAPPGWAGADLERWRELRVGALAVVRGL